MPPESPVPGDVTALLRQWSAGDASALGSVIEVAYSELRAIAAGYLKRESRDHTLQATALVNELYLRLARQRTAAFVDRRHFCTFAAMMMRRILSDHARHAHAQKRPEGERIRIPLHPDMAWIDAGGEDMLALDQAMGDLEALGERRVRILELRYFLGCSNEETAEILGIARATVVRDLQLSKAWLYRRLHPEAGSAPVSLK
jgi:RNA polymerase sigma factor (TIGR02999 family)